MESIGYAAIQIIPSMQGVATSVNRELQKQMPAAGRQAGGSFASGFERAAASMAKTAGVAVAAAAGAAGVAAAKAMSAGWSRLTSVQDATAALTISLGDSAAAAGLLENVLETVQGTPFNFDEFASAAQQMVGMGLEAEKVPGYLEAIGEASATQGGRANEMAGRLSTVFGQIASSGQVMLRDVWRISETGVNALAILANHFGVTTGEMKKMISDGAVPAERALDALAKGILHGSTGPAGATVALAGTMEALRETMSGAVEGIEPAMARLGAALIEPFSPVIVASANALVDTLKELTDRAGSWADAIAGSSAVDMFVDAMKGLPDVLGSSVSLLADIAPVASAALSGLTAFGLGSIPILNSVLPAVNPVAAAIAGLVLATPEARVALAELAQGVAPLVREVGEKLLPVIAGLSELAGEVLPPAIELFGGGLKVALKTASELASALGPLTRILADHEDIVLAVAAAYGAWKLAEWGRGLTKLAGGIDAASASWKFYRGEIAAIAATRGVSEMTAATGVLGASIREIGKGGNLRLIASGIGEMSRNLFAVSGDLMGIGDGVSAGFAKVSTGLKNIATRSVSTGAAIGGALAGIAIGAAAATYALDKLHESGRRDAGQWLSGIAPPDLTQVASAADYLATIQERISDLQEEMDSGSTNFFDDQKLAAEILELTKAHQELQPAVLHGIRSLNEFRDASGFTADQLQDLIKASGLDLTNAFDAAGQPSKELAEALARVSGAAETVGVSLEDIEFTPEQIEKLEADAKAIEDAMAAAGASFRGAFDVLSLSDDPVDPEAVKAAEKAVAAAKEQVAEAEKAARESGQTADESERTAKALADARDNLVDANRRLQDLRASDSPLNAARIREFYETAVVDAEKFGADYRAAVEAGYDPQLLARMLAAGPAEAGDLLAVLAANTSQAFVDMVNEGEEALSQFSALAVEHARLTQMVIQETGKDGRRMSELLATAIAIATAQMQSDAELSIQTLADLTGASIEEVREAARLFGIEIGTLKEKTEAILGDIMTATSMSRGQIFGSGSGDYGFRGGRASGGPVWPGTWLVGEEGPELITVGGSGHVFDTASTLAALAGQKESGKQSRGRGRGPLVSVVAASDAESVGRVVSHTVRGW